MSDKFEKLIEMFAKLPSIGPRQATRLVLAMLNWPDAKLQEFAHAIETLKDGTLFCQTCFNLSDISTCSICNNDKRQQNKIAVVERITDLSSMEKTGAFDGVYHVLGGTIDPTQGSTPDHLRIKELMDRVRGVAGAEIILALSPTTQGDTTALYLEQELASLNVTITRLARGLAAGTALEYADEMTLANALKDRR